MKYKFLSLTPDIIGNDIIANIDESVILIDLNMKIIMVNSKTNEFLDPEKLNINNTHLSEIIHEFNIIKNDIYNIVSGKTRNFSSDINFIDGNRLIYMRVRFFLIKDRFCDILGILMIGKEIMGFEHFNKLYKITNREKEVVQYMITGRTNKEIAEIIKTAERTVKSHITNIYNKIGIDNKIELINILKDFDVISESKNVLDN